MQTTLTNRVSRNDQFDIDCLVSAFPNMPLDFYAVQMHNSIKNITPYHYIYLGIMIGEIEATESVLIDFHNQQNPLSKCRAN